MSIIALVCAPLVLTAVVVLLVRRPWVDRGRRKVPWEHARLSRKHKRAWKQLRAANVDVAATGALIEERWHSR